MDEKTLKFYGYLRTIYVLILYAQGKKITASNLSPICAVGDFMISLKGKLVSNRYTHLCKKMRDKSLAGLLLPVNAR